MTSPRKYIIFGGAGFLGSHIAKALLDQGKSVVFVYDLVSPEEGDEVEGVVEYFVGDIVDEDRVVNVLQQTQPDVVFHTVSPRLDMDPEVHHKVNVDGTKVLLSACRKVDITKLVFTSTTMVVWSGLPFEGVAENVQIAEHGADAYHHTKAIAERLILGHNEVNGLRTTVLRPCGMIGEGDNQLIWRLAKYFKEGRDNIQIGDNRNVVDYVYVGNAATAHVLAADRLFDDPTKVAGEVFFITNGSPVRQWEFHRMFYREFGRYEERRAIKIPFIVAMIMAFLVEIFCKMTGMKSEFNRFAVRYLTTVQWYDINKARSQLGYEPRVTLAEGVKRSVEWWKKKGEEQLQRRNMGYQI